MSCPRNKHAFRPAVAGSVGRFSSRERRASRTSFAILLICVRAARPKLVRDVRSESRGRETEKRPIGRGPEGCDENGPAAVPRPRDRLRIALDMRPPRALPAAHFDRNERHAYFGDRTLVHRLVNPFGFAMTLNRNMKSVISVAIAGILFSSCAQLATVKNVEPLPPAEGAIS